MAQTQNIEQQIRLLSTLQLAFAIAAGVFLLVAVILFVYLKIPQVFNEYRGKNAKKEMEKIASGKTESRRIRTANKKRYYTEHLSENQTDKMEHTGQQVLACMEETVAETDVLSISVQEQSDRSEENTIALDGVMMQSIQNLFEVEQSIILLYTDQVI